MPRKVTSSGVSTTDRNTSLRRATGAAKTSGAKKKGNEVADGGKWAGSGRKVVEHGRGPEIAQQGETGRGPKTKTVHRKDRSNHPSHG
jgi:hypothetical protein